MARAGRWARTLLPSALIGLVALSAGSFSDEGEILLIAARMAEGEVLYRDVFTHHFPLPYLLTALLFRVTGRSLPAARLGLLGLTLATFAWLGRRGDRRSTARLTCLAWVLLAPFAAANLVIYPVFSALSLLMVFVLGRDLLAARTVGSSPASLPDGAMLGLAIAAAGLSDPLTVYPIGVLASALLVRRFQPRPALAVMVASCAGVVGLVLAIGLATGALDDFWRDAIQFNRTVYPAYRSDASALRIGAMLAAIQAFLGLGDPRFWLDPPGRSLRFAQIGDFDGWLFSGGFFRLAVLSSVGRWALAGRLLNACYTLGFGAALLAVSDRGFRGLPFQALALWLAAEQVLALSAPNALASDRDPGRGRRSGWRRRQANLEQVALAMAAGGCLLLGGWLLGQSALGLWRNRAGLAWGASTGAYRAKGLELRRLVNDPKEARLAWYPYEPYIDFFAALPPVTRYPNLLPWTAEWADGEVAQALGRAVATRRPTLVGFDPTRWFWDASLDTGSHAPRTWRRLRESCRRIDVDLFVCGPPVAPDLAVIDPSIPAEQPLPEMLAGTRAVQRFRAECAGLSQVSVRLATFARNNAASIAIAVVDLATGRELALQPIAGRRVVDNVWQRLALPRQAASRGRAYAIELRSADGAPGDALTAWRSQADRYPEGELSIDGEAQDGDLVFAYACAMP